MSQKAFSGWRRTWPDRSYDFVLVSDGVTIGRIYRHHDERRWQWFRQHPAGEAGICDSKEEAVRALEEKTLLPDL